MNFETKRGLLVLLAVALVVLMIVVGPIITIWCLNTLFGLTIAYNFSTWLAAFLLTGLVVARKY